MSSADEICYTEERKQHTKEEKTDPVEAEVEG